MVFDDSVDIKVNVKSFGKRGLEKLSDAADDLSRSLSGTGLAAEGAEEGIEDLNDELWEGVTSTGAYESQLGALQTQLTMSKIQSEAFGDELDDLIGDIVDADDVTEEFVENLADLEDRSAVIEGFDDFIAPNITQEFERTLQDMVDAEEIGRADLAQSLYDDTEIFDASEETVEGMRKMAERFDAIGQISREWSGAMQDILAEVDQVEEIKSLGPHGATEFRRVDTSNLSEFIDDAIRRVITDEDLEGHHKGDFEEAVRRVQRARLKNRFSVTDDELDDLSLFKSEDQVSSLALGFFQRAFTEGRDVDNKYSNVDIGNQDIGGLLTRAAGFDEIESPEQNFAQDILRVMGFHKGNVEHMKNPQKEFFDVMVEEWADIPETSEMIEEISGEVRPGTLAGADLDTDTPAFIEELSEMVQGDVTQRAVFKDIIDTLTEGTYHTEGETKGVPVTSETVQMELMDRLRQAETDAVRNLLLQMESKLERGNIKTRSIASRPEFRERLFEDLRSQFIDLGLPEEGAEKFADQVSSELQEAADAEGPGTFIEDLVKDTRKLDEILESTLDSLSTMDSSFEELEDMTEEIQNNTLDYFEAISAGAEDVTDEFRSETAPGLAYALGDDSPFIFEDRFRRRDDDESIFFQKGRIMGQAESIGETMDDALRYGNELFPGGIPLLYRGVDRTEKEFDFFESSAKEVMDTLDDFHEMMKGALPDAFQNASASIGGITVGLRNLTGVLYTAVILVGPLITAVLGLASAFLTATAAIGAFVGVGAVGFLDQMVASMAGVNDRAEAMQRLMEILKRDVMAAMRPLQDAQLGGDGPTGVQMFVDTIEGGLALLHDFAHLASRIVELDVVQNSIARIIEALSTSDDGPLLGDAIVESIQELLPIVTDFFAYLINNLPEFIAFMTDVTTTVAPALGSLMANLIPLLAIGIDVGAEFIAFMAKFFNVLALVAQGFIMVLDAMVSVVNVITGLIPFIDQTAYSASDLLGVVATLIGVYWAWNMALSIGSTLLAAVNTLTAGYATAIALAAVETYSAAGAMGLLNVATSGLASAIGYLKATALYGYIQTLYSYIVATGIAATETGILSTMMGVLSGALGTVQAAIYGVWAAITAHPIGALLTALAALVVVLWEIGNEGGLLPKIVDWGDLLNDTISFLADNVQGLAYAFGLVTGPLGMFAAILNDLGNEGGLLPKLVDWMQVFEELSNGVAWAFNQAKQRVDEMVGLLMQYPAIRKIVNGVAAGMAFAGWAGRTLGGVGRELERSTNGQGEGPGGQIYNDVTVFLQGGSREDGKKVGREVERRLNRRQRYAGTNYHG